MKSPIESITKDGNLIEAEKYKLLSLYDNNIIEYYKRLWRNIKSRINENIQLC